MTVTHDSRIAAALLAGGLSTRMGTNKALLRLPGPGGRTMIEEVVARLHEAGFPAPLLVTNSPGDYASLGLRMVPDDVPGAGPLGGILTALNHGGAERVLIAGCDMPLISPALLRAMVSLAEAGEFDALVPRWLAPEGPRPEPLLAVYSRSALPTILSRVESGELRMGTMLQHLNVRYIDEANLRLHDPDLLSFVNVNTPQEWQAVPQAGRPATGDRKIWPLTTDH